MSSTKQTDKKDIELVPAQLVVGPHVTEDARLIMSAWESDRRCVGFADDNVNDDGPPFSNSPVDHIVSLQVLCHVSGESSL